jgi:hypothetical protein
VEAVVESTARLAQVTDHNYPQGFWNLEGSSGQIQTLRIIDMADKEIKNL